MKVYVTKTYGEEKFFSASRKARKAGSDIRIMHLDIESLPHEGCTLEEIEEWDDVIDLWLLD